MEVMKSLPYFAHGIIKKHIYMPTIFSVFGYKFYFYANDHTPIHIHVIRGGAKAKYKLFPVSLEYNYGFKSSELKMIESIIEDNEEIIAQHRNTFFNTSK